MPLAARRILGTGRALSYGPVPASAYGALVYDDWRAPNAVVHARVPVLRVPENTWQQKGGAAAVSGNVLLTNHASTASCYVTFDTGQTDILISASRIVFPSSGTTRVAGVMIRYTDTTHHYRARLDLTNSDFSLVLANAGNTTIGTVAGLTITAGAEYTIVLRAQGTSFSATAYKPDGSVLADIAPVINAVLGATSLAGLYVNRNVGGAGVSYGPVMALPYAAPLGVYNGLLLAMAYT